MSTPSDPQFVDEAIPHRRVVEQPLDEGRTERQLVDPRPDEGATARHTVGAPVDDRTVVDRRVPDQPVQDRVQEQWVPQERVQEQYPATTGAEPYGQAATDLGLDRHSVVTRQEERFGGIKLGSSFFGWICAVGIAVLLLALLTATGVALGLTTGTTTAEINQQATAGTGTARTVGLVGGIAALVVLFVAYFCGGYVAARMARFNGAKQGLSVWLWGLLITGIVALLAAVFGSKYNIFASLNLPRIPVSEGTMTTAGIISVVAALLVTLAAALLGGRAGMRFHHRVDKVGLGN